MDKAQYDELSGKLDKLATSFDGIGTQIGEAVANALKPVTDSLTEMQNADKARKEAEKATLVNKVVGTGLLTEAVANTLTMEALTELSAKAGKTTQRGAAPIANSSFDPAGGETATSAYKLPGAREAK